MTKITNSRLCFSGVKKQAAKVAKTVKYGSNVEGISTVEPEQYALRFLEFISNAIEWKKNIPGAHN